MKDLFQEMTDGLPLLVSMHDRTGDKFLVNERFCEFFGVTRDDIFGQRWQLPLHPEDVDTYQSSFRACLQERRAFHGEARVRTSGGEWRWLESWALPRFGTSGDFRGMVMASVDVTERKRAAADANAAHQAMRLQQAHLEAAYNAIEDGVIVFDMTGQVVLLNAAEAQTYGYPTVEAMKQNLDHFARVFELEDMRGEILPTIAWPVARALRGERFEKLKLRARRRDTGQTWIVSFSGGPVVDGDGRQSFALIVSRDVTDQERIERELRASESAFGKWPILRPR
ncbi:MAG: PAS domain S-box protein [Myxococcales bacterium]|nr:PAS domain S-box protein [Myxococcales bacterium]